MKPERRSLLLRSSTSYMQLSEVWECNSWGPDAIERRVCKCCKLSCPFCRSMGIRIWARVRRDDGSASSYWIPWWIRYYIVDRRIASSIYPRIVAWAVVACWESKELKIWILCRLLIGESLRASLISEHSSRNKRKDARWIFDNNSLKGARTLKIKRSWSVAFLSDHFKWYLQDDDGSIWLRSCNARFLQIPLIIARQTNSVIVWMFVNFQFFPPTCIAWTNKYKRNWTEQTMSSLSSRETKIRFVSQPPTFISFIYKKWYSSS